MGFFLRKGTCYLVLPLKGFDSFIFIMLLIPNLRQVYVINLLLLYKLRLG
jgi:hypothetical protein